MILSKDDSKLNKIFSVIIPVYNAGQYLTQSVESAISQFGVGEVLLIEDGSTDKSFEICEVLQHSHSNIKLFTHPNHENKGAGASRNLGIVNATYPWIAFLDADDYYLENRFLETIDSMKNNNIQFIIESSIYEHDLDSGENIINLNSSVVPESLFEILWLSKGNSWICINSVCIHKELINKVGFFDETLLQSQDTDYFLRIALSKPNFTLNKRVVSVIRNHKNRRVHNNIRYNHYRYLLFRKWYYKMLDNSWLTKVNRHIVRGHLYTYSEQRLSNTYFEKPFKVIVLIFWILKNPSLVFKIL